MGIANKLSRKERLIRNLDWLRKPDRGMRVSYPESSITADMRNEILHGPFYLTVGAGAGAEIFLSGFGDAIGGGGSGSLVAGNAAYYVGTKTVISFMETDQKFSQFLLGGINVGNRNRARIEGNIYYDTSLSVNFFSSSIGVAYVHPIGKQ